MPTRHERSTAGSRRRIQRHLARDPQFSTIAARLDRHGEGPIDEPLVMLVATDDDNVCSRIL